MVFIWFLFSFNVKNICGAFYHVILALFWRKVMAAWRLVHHVRIDCSDTSINSAPDAPIENGVLNLFTSAEEIIYSTDSVCAKYHKKITSGV